ncbi:MAG: hypothetical protein HYW70_03560 [Candidatus Nealsonbacteria bacterium]|nr:hypothetical protein [Candidatus Nealsonbacteria bacterium]
MFNKKIVLLITAVIIVAAVVVGYFYFFKPKPELKGTIGAAKEATKSVPEISTNPGENVPEVNPLDLANPFKYKNPLR